MMPLYRRFLYIALILSAGCLASCERSEEERALYDLGIGRHELHGLTWRIHNGLAFVRSSTHDHTDLWSQSPVVHFTVRADADAQRHWTWTFHNAMPNASLTVSDPTVSVHHSPTATNRPTQRAFSVVFPPGEVDATFTLAPPDFEEETSWHFAVLSDVQEDIGRVQDIFERMNRDPHLHFVASTGDLTSTGTRAELERFQTELQGLHIPFYTTLGNHELGDDWRHWHALFGRANFNFAFKHTHFSFIDSASATIDPIVYRWLDRWLKQARNHTHIVLTHIAPLDPAGTRNGSFGSRREAGKFLARLAKNDVDLTLYGHIHSYYAFSNAGIPAYISGGGGALPERFDGIERHYLKVTVEPDGVSEVSLVRVDEH